MKLIGHTMAIPGMDIVQGIRLFASLGLDGIELVAQENTPFHIDLEHAQIERIMDASREYNLPIAAITPYFWAINSADEAVRRQNIDGLKRAILLALHMGAKFVRAYGGKQDAGGTPEENFQRTVEALQDAGKLADEHGVVIMIENHPGTMTRTGKATRRMIDAVGMRSVVALYDPCNVLYDTDEDWLTTFEVQKDVIGYIHCKDYFLKDEKRVACPVGQGIVPWIEIIRKFRGMDINVSFEYEKRWYPDQLPDAQVGLAECIRYLMKEALQ